MGKREKIIQEIRVKLQYLRRDTYRLEKELNNIERLNNSLEEEDGTQDGKTKQ